MRRIVVITLLLGCFVPFYSALASDQFGTDSHRAKLSLGSYVISRADSTFALNERNLGLGVSINPHESLGTDLEQTVFRLDGGYRFNPNHSVHFSWYKITNSGSKIVRKDFDWVDQEGNEYTIGAGSELYSRLSYDITKLSYRWTFYGNEKVQLFANAGLHYSQFSVEVEVTSTVTGSAPETSARDVDSSIPLPVVGGGVRYNITPQWNWYLKSEFFALKYDKWEGIYSDLLLGIEYMPFKHFGIGMAIGTNNLNVVEETNEYRFVYDNRISGVVLQLTTQF